MNNYGKKKRKFLKNSKRKSWKRTSKNPYVIRDRIMGEDTLLRKNKKISHFIVGEMVSIINGKKLIESYITREKVGFTLGHFEYKDPLSEKIRSKKTKAKLNFLEKRKNR